MSLVLSSPFLPPSPYLLPSPSPSSTLQLSPRINNITTIISSSSIHNDNNNHNSGRLVDQSMIILRCRIHQLKTLEQPHDPQPPSHWLPWEKHIYQDYDSIICHFIAHLQTFFMDTRPSFALTICLLLALSLTSSTALLTLHFFHLLQSLLSSASS